MSALVVVDVLEVEEEEYVLVAVLVLETGLARVELFDVLLEVLFDCISVDVVD